MFHALKRDSPRRTATRFVRRLVVLWKSFSHGRPVFVCMVSPMPSRFAAADLDEVGEPVDIFMLAGRDAKAEDHGRFETALAKCAAVHVGFGERSSYVVL